MLRLVVKGKRREMGLGRWPDVTIAEARERAAQSRRQLRDGVHPIEERAKLRRRIDRLTVEQAIDQCFEARKAELKGDGQAGRWMSPLSVHVIPKIGKKAIEDVDQHQLKVLLDPIWREKPQAASKALNRLNLTLKHAAALGLDVDLPTCKSGGSPSSNLRVAIGSPRGDLMVGYDPSRSILSRAGCPARAVWDSLRKNLHALIHWLVESIVDLP